MEKNLKFISNIFTHKVIDECIKLRENTMYNCICDNFPLSQNNLLNKEIIKNYYKYLLKNYKHEYIFKNMLLNKLLLGVHNINTSSVLAELPVANSKADFILINGKAVLYEIKTEFDNLVRLENQLSDYYKAFPEIYIVISYNDKAKINHLLNLENIGIIALQKNNRFKTIRIAKAYYDKLDPICMFKILRKHEFEQVLMQKFGKLPQTNQFEYYDMCLEMFEKIELLEANQLFFKELKKRPKVNVECFFKIPYELKLLAYLKEPKETWYKDMFNFLEQKYRSN